jgi:uncharacterized protein (DUF2147 family)
VRIFFIFPVLLTFLSLASHAQDYKAYEGYFWTQEKDAIFEIVISEEADQPTIMGITRWGTTEGRLDEHNPDPNLKDRPLVNLTFLWDFSYEAKKNRWSDGKVYDPNNGKTYSAKMSLEKDGNILKMRGYVGISLLGRTAKFERVKTEDLPETLVSGTTITETPAP